MLNAYGARVANASLVGLVLVRQLDFFAVRTIRAMGSPANHTRLASLNFLELDKAY